MTNFTPIEKRSKKAQKEFYKKNRNENSFNTGTRDMKTAKKKSRAEKKRLDRKVFKEYTNNRN